MKYYFPTSTLNFDAVYSSMSVMPPAYHRDEAIWFSRYFKTGVDVSDDIVVLYSCPVKWEVIDEGSVDYPMLVEMDSSIVDSLLLDAAHSVKTILPSGISCVCGNIPIVFKTADILSGKIKIVFRNQQERKALESRARVGVAECKFASVLEVMGVDIFREVFPADAVAFDVIKPEVLEAVGNSGLKFSFDDFVEYEHQDREKGAEAGFIAGKWLRSIRDGYCFDCFRGGLDYRTWKGSVPLPFSKVIDMICGKVGFRWDVNREAIVNFCTECWKNCFEGTAHSSCKDEWHVMLRKIAKHHKDPTFTYPISAIQDGYMQALGCFVNSGRKGDLLAKNIRDDHVAMPEFACALFGALVGYTVFPRTLFECRSFDASLSSTPQPLPPPMSKPITTQPQRQPLTEKVGEKPSPLWVGKVLHWFSSFVSLSPKTKNKGSLETSLHETLNESRNENEFLVKLAQHKGWGKRTKMFQELKSTLELDKSTHEPDLFASVEMKLSALPTSEIRSMPLCDDPQLCDAIRKEFPNEAALPDKIQMFCSRYYKSGYYGQKPDQYKRENPDLIDHLLRCFKAHRTEDLNYIFVSHAEEDRFVEFLESRYGCKRKTTTYTVTR